MYNLVAGTAGYTGGTDRGGILRAAGSGAVPEGVEEGTRVLAGIVR
jgi:hypothetical protein